MVAGSVERTYYHMPHRFHPFCSIAVSLWRILCFYAFRRKITFFLVLPTIIRSYFSPEQPIPGKEFIIECQYEGFPQPSASWRKGNATLSDSSNVRISSKVGLAIIQVNWTTEEDNGVYECVISNNAGLVSRSFVVQLSSKC